jgi:hypothetical protein
MFGLKYYLGIFLIIKIDNYYKIKTQISKISCKFFLKKNKK